MSARPSARRSAGSCGSSAHVAPGRRALRHGAEPAAAGAQVAQDHERGRAAMKAFVDIRAARGLANRMQVQPPEAGFQSVQAIGSGCGICGSIPADADADHRSGRETRSLVLIFSRWGGNQPIPGRLRPFRAFRHHGKGPPERGRDHSGPCPIIAANPLSFSVRTTTSASGRFTAITCR